MDFKNITDEQMLKAVEKFRDTGASLRLGNSPAANLLTYEMMANSTEFCSVGQLRSSLLNYAKGINVVPNDPVLGTNPTYAFSSKTTAGRQVVYTLEDCYLAIRSAFIKRKDDEEYKKKVLEAKEAEKVLEANKSKKDIIAEAKAKIAAVDAVDLED